MKRFCFLAVLIALSSSAHAGRSISFNVGSHRVHDRILQALPFGLVRLDVDLQNASTGAASVTAMTTIATWPCRQSLCHRRHRRFRRPLRRHHAPPAKTIVAAPPPAVYTTAASRTPYRRRRLQPLRHRFSRFQFQRRRRHRSRKPVETAQPAPQVERVSHQAEEEPSDSPIGDWQTEGKGTVRIAKCGNALCGFVLGSSNEKGEAILINMKPKTERQWTGGVYSQD